MDAFIAQQFMKSIYRKQAPTATAPTRPSLVWGETTPAPFGVWVAWELAVVGLPLLVPPLLPEALNCVGEAPPPARGSIVVVSWAEFVSGVAWMEGVKDA